jgi:two-component system sensor histidine kinase DesK
MSCRIQDARHWWASGRLLTVTAMNAFRTTPWKWAASIFGILWVGVPVVDLATSDPSPLQIAVVAVALPAFAALFLLTVMERRPPIAGLVGMLVTAAVLTLAHDSFGLLFGYPVAAAGVRLPERENVLAVLAITAIAAATIAISGGADGAVFWGVTSAVFTTGAVWMLIGGLVRANSQLRDARAELAELAVAEERLRFARDLHDLLGQDLSLIALKAELAGKLLPDRVEQAATEVEQIQTLTRSALAQVREAVGGYRQPTLASELAGARMALEAAGIELRVEAPTEPLPPEVESVLAWAVREGATNVIRHSGARHAAIAIRPATATVELEISDDGQGGGHPGGHGLGGLSERAGAIGGTVEAGASADGGFQLRVRVPAWQAASAA